MLLTVYFWLMLAYLALTLVSQPLLRRRRPDLPGYSRAAMAEHVAGYALLAAGLLGVWGHLHAVAFGVAGLWQAYVVVLVAFAALQHRMPKTRQLREAHGPRAVITVTVVGVLMLAPMVYATSRYAWWSPSLWSGAPAVPALSASAAGAA